MLVSCLSGCSTSRLLFAPLLFCSPLAQLDQPHQTTRINNSSLVVNVRCKPVERPARELLAGAEVTLQLLYQRQQACVIIVLVSVNLVFAEFQKETNFHKNKLTSQLGNAELILGDHRDITNCDARIPRAILLLAVRQVEKCPHLVRSKHTNLVLGIARDAAQCPRHILLDAAVVPARQLH